MDSKGEYSFQSMHDRDSVRLVFMGTPQFCVPALQRLVAAAYDVVAVYTQPDRPSGRGRIPSGSAGKTAALALGLPVYQPDNIGDEKEIERLKGLKPDALVVVAYGRLLPRKVLDIPKCGALNLHPSLLPRHRGASPIASAILAGDEETGVTLMILDEGTDTGPILAQRRLPVPAKATTATLSLELAEYGADLLIESLPSWFAGRLSPQPQDETLATYSGQISKADGELDWSLSALDLERRVRAFNPWPSAYTWWQGRLLKIIEAEVVEGQVDAAPGTVEALSDDPDVPLGVVCGRDVLGLRRIQIEGKRALLAREFVLGQRGFVGQQLGHHGT